MWVWNYWENLGFTYSVVTFYSCKMFQLDGLLEWIWFIQRIIALTCFILFLSVLLELLSHSQWHENTCRTIGHFCYRGGKHYQKCWPHALCVSLRLCVCVYLCCRSPLPPAISPLSHCWWLYQQLLHWKLSNINNALEIVSASMEHAWCYHIELQRPSHFVLLQKSFSVASY